MQRNGYSYIADRNMLYKLRFADDKVIFVQDEDDIKFMA